MSHTLTEGGQIASHRFRMLRQVLKVAVSISFFIGICVFVALMSSIPKVSFLATWYYFKAYALQSFFKEIEVGIDFLSLFSNIRYDNTLNLSPAYVIKLTTHLTSQLMQKSYTHFIQSMIASIFCMFTVLAFFFYKGTTHVYSACSRNDTKRSNPVFRHPWRRMLPNLAD